MCALVVLVRNGTVSALLPVVETYAALHDPYHCSMVAAPPPSFPQGQACDVGREAQQRRHDRWLGGAGRMAVSKRDRWTTHGIEPLGKKPSRVWNSFCFFPTVFSLGAWAKLELPWTWSWVSSETA